MQNHPEALRTLLAFNAHMLRQIAADLPEEVLDEPIVPASNTPRWILAHLSVGLDFALLAIGAPTLLQRVWLVGLGPGSSGQFPEGLKPSKAELLEKLENGILAVDRALQSLDPASDRWQRPHSAKLLDGTPLTTIGSTVGHLITTHFALHIGQLSLARRKRGHRPII